MSSSLQNATIKLFEKHIREYKPQDPLYESSTDARGKQHNKKRPLPPGLSPRDEKILKSVRRRAHYLDKGFSVCGFQFGWSFIYGIIPGAGDIIDASLSYYLIIRKARQAELPAWVVGRMLTINAVAVCVGFVPIVGDIIMAVFKPNSINAEILERFLVIRGKAFLEQQEEQRRTEGVPPSDIDHVKPGAGMSDGTLSLSKSKFWSLGKARRRNTQVVPSPQGALPKDVESTAPSSGGVQRR